MVGVEAQHALGDCALIKRNLQVIFHVDAPDDQHLAVQLNLTRRFRCQSPFTRGDAARLQRATKSPRQSTGRGSHHVVKCGRVRLVNGAVVAVVLRHF